MDERSKHSYIAKSTSSDEGISLSEYNADTLNFSRTLANAKNWIGCGYMTKSKSHLTHKNVRFPFFSLVIVVDGTGSFVDKDNNSYNLSSGSIFQRRPGESHSSYVEADSRWREYYLDCDSNLYKHLSSMGIIEASEHVFTIKIEPSLLKMFESLLSRLDTLPNQKLPDLYLEYITLLMHIFSMRSHHATPISSDDMIYIASKDFEELHRTRFDLKEYCTKKGWGYDSFRKRFKNEMGISPREYLVRRRMEVACQLLRSSSKKISVIAFELGYASPYEFSNQFSKNFGVYPTHFRSGIMSVT